MLWRPIADSYHAAAGSAGGDTTLPRWQLMAQQVTNCHTREGHQRRRRSRSKPMRQTTVFRSTIDHNDDASAGRRQISVNQRWLAGWRSGPRENVCAAAWLTAARVCRSGLTAVTGIHDAILGEKNRPLTDAGSVKLQQRKIVLVTCSSTIRHALAGTQATSAAYPGLAAQMGRN